MLTKVVRSFVGKTTFLADEGIGEFNTLGCPDYSFDQIIDLVKQVGYTCVAMRIYKNTEDLRTLDEFKLENLWAIRRKFVLPALT